MSCGVILQIENVFKSQQKIGRKKKIQCDKRELLTREFIQDDVLLLIQVKEY